MYKLISIYPGAKDTVTATFEFEIGIVEYANIWLGGQATVIDIEQLFRGVIYNRFGDCLKLERG